MGYLSHNRGSREVGGDFHPQTLLWAARMASASYTVTGYQKRVHTTFCNALKSAGCLSSPIQFIAPVWGAAAPNMVSVLSSLYTASINGTLIHSGGAVRPSDATSWIRSGMDGLNWLPGFTSGNSGQLYYTTSYITGAEWDMGVRVSPGTVEGLTLGNYNGIVYAHSGYGSQITYGSVASETDSLVCFNSNATGQQLMKCIAANSTANIGANQTAQSSAIPNDVYPFCGLHTVGAGVQLNTLTRSHKAFMLFNNASHAQAAAISNAVYNYVNALPGS